MIYFAGNICMQGVTSYLFEYHSEIDAYYFFFRHARSGGSSETWSRIQNADAHVRSFRLSRFSLRYNVKLLASAGGEKTHIPVPKLLFWRLFCKRRGQLQRNILDLFVKLISQETCLSCDSEAFDTSLSLPEVLHLSIFLKKCYW